MNATLEALVLGLVQGLTEWLPVSSSGHLQIMRALLGTEPSLWYDLLLHLGTLAVVVWAYRREIPQLIKAAVDTSHQLHQFAWGLAIASVPIAAAGFLLQGAIEAAFSSLIAVGIALLCTAAMLHSTKHLDGVAPIKPASAWTIGLWQGLALFPGISRSGATIAGALHAGIDRKTAADFGFLLAIPALVGATLFKLLDLGGAVTFTAPMALGMLVSMVTGYATLQWLRGVVARHGIHVFAPYCFVVGAAVLVVSI